MLDVRTLHQKIEERYARDRKSLVIADTYALSIVAADVASLWGLNVTDGTFYKRDITEVVAEFRELNDHDKVMLEWAILDNISAYCAWIEPRRRSLRTAAPWTEHRPPYLNPLRYKYQRPIEGDACV